jgi:hypothetical protein
MKDETTLDGCSNIFIDYHSSKISHDTAVQRMILKAGDLTIHESKPCVYVP